MAENIGKVIQISGPAVDVNRVRQAAITKEIIEIVSGAAAV